MDSNLRALMHFFALIFLIPGIVLVIMGLRYRRKKGFLLRRLCQKTTEGKVIGYSQTAFTSNDDDRYHTDVKERGLHLPIISYKVKGREYQVVGPMFHEFTRDTTSVPWSSYADHLEDMPMEFARYQDDEADYDPIKAMFPIGTKVNVYYNEKDPSYAYAIRYYPIDTYMLLYFGMGIGFIAVAIGVWIMNALNIPI